MRNLNIDAEALFLIKKFDDVFGKMVNVDDDLIKPKGIETLDDVFQILERRQPESALWGACLSRAANGFLIRQQKSSLS